jgi:tetratricopeptide (TPR) repeat protein
MMSPHGWALLTEANRLIRGVELKDDPTYQFLQQKIARELAAIRPELADHDLALLFQPNEPRLYLARAQRFADLSRWEEAEADFQKATSLKSDDPLNWLAIGQYWLSRQNLAKAGESYARAVELDHTQAWTHVLNKVLTGNDALLAAALATQPQNAELWTLRGQQMCEAGRWAKAAEAWQKRIALGQTDHMTQYQLALLQAASGKVNGYGETCRKMLEQFAAAETSEATNFVAWACVVAPGALADYAPAVQLAQQFADANFALPFAHNTLGAALLRSGRADEAVRELTLADQWIEASETMGQTSPAYAWYLLAIAHSQLGQSATARQWYDKASSWVAQTVAERERAGQLKWPWNRRLTIELLEREAAQVLQDAAHEGT